MRKLFVVCWLAVLFFILGGNIYLYINYGKHETPEEKSYNDLLLKRPNAKMCRVLGDGKYGPLEKYPFIVDLLKKKFLEEVEADYPSVVFTWKQYLSVYFVLLNIILWLYDLLCT